MGQKVNPIGFRLGYVYGWDSSWYADKKDFAAKLMEDAEIRKYVMTRLPGAAIAKIVIERTIKLITFDLNFLYLCFKFLGKNIGKLGFCQIVFQRKVLLSRPIFMMGLIWVEFWIQGEKILILNKVFSNILKYLYLIYRPNMRSSSVTCYPLYDILTQMNRTHVDYFSLDVEGHELAVLKTIPFEKLDITVMRILTSD